MPSRRPPRVTASVRASRGAKSNNRIERGAVMMAGSDRAATRLPKPNNRTLTLRGRLPAGPSGTAPTRIQERKTGSRGSRCYRRLRPASPASRTWAWRRSVLHPNRPDASQDSSRELPGRGGRLAPEAFARRARTTQFRADDLDDHQPAERLLPREVHQPHAPVVQRPQDLAVPEPLQGRPPGRARHLLVQRLDARASVLLDAGVPVEEFGGRLDQTIAARLEIAVVQAVVGYAAGCQSQETLDDSTPEQVGRSFVNRYRVATPVYAARLAACRCSASGSGHMTPRRPAGAEGHPLHRLARRPSVTLGHLITFGLSPTACRIVGS